MNQSILRALVQLFALVAHSDSSSKNGRNVVEQYLHKLLNKSQVEEYLNLFDEFLGSYHKEKDDKKEKKQFSANAVKILKLCTRINEELTHPQKLIVLVRLIEFLKANNTPAKIAFEFAETVSDTFNIENKEFSLCYGLIENDLERLNNKRVLLIGNKQDGLENANYWQSEFSIDGLISIVSIQSAEFYFIIYRGVETIELNGQEIVAGSVFTLGSGAILRIPKIGVIYFSDINALFLSDRQQTEINFDVDQISYTFPNGTKALHKLSFETNSGKLCGIMGGSGAGKSTLLQLLNGSQKPNSGSISVNGIDFYDPVLDLKKLIGFVSQDDLLMEDLTVYQNLYYSAKLSFAGINKEKLEEKVKQLLIALGLFDVKDLKVGNPLEKYISGGQRKRLNIALELIREPEILFVDEPTSGLSSRDSERIMELLKNMALAGKLIFVVIHQPSSSIFKMFDQLLILDLGGYPIYQGNPMEAAGYFKNITNQVSAMEIECNNCGNVNPEQIFDIIESKVVDEYGRPTQNRKIAPSEWYVLYKREMKQLNSKKYHELPLPERKTKKPSRWKQFKVFFNRDLKSKLANKQYLLINLLEAPVLALLLAFFIKSWKNSGNEAYTFFNNANISAYMLICVIAALFIGMTVSAEEIFKDRKIRKREKFLQLSNGSYLCSKVALLFILSAIQTFSFVWIGNFILEIEDMNSAYWLVMFSTSCFANLLGLNISSAFNSAVTIYIIIPLLLIPQLLLSGIIVRFDNLNPKVTNPDRIPFVAELMASRWAFEALAVHQFTDNAFEKQFYELNRKKSASNFYEQFWIPAFKQKVVNYADQENAAEKEKQNLIQIIEKVPYFQKMPLWKGDYNADWEQFYRYAEKLERFFQKLNQQAVQERDKIIKAGDNQTFVDLRLSKSNDYIDRLLKGSDRSDKMLETETKIIQVMDPVYRMPTQHFFAHHFAPAKKIGNYYIKTLYFNVFIIFLMTFVLFVLLYFDGLKWLIQKISRTR